MSAARMSTSFEMQAQQRPDSASGSARTSYQSFRNSIASTPAPEVEPHVEADAEAQTLPMPATTPSGSDSQRPLSAATEQMLRVQYDAIGAFFGGGRQARNSAPPIPTPAPTATPAAAEEARNSQGPLPVEVLQMQYDAIGAFFGGGRQRQSSRPTVPAAVAPASTTNDNASSSPASAAAQAQAGARISRVPPAYASASDMDMRSSVDAESLPSYTKVDTSSDSVFSRKLFFYGFSASLSS